MSSSIDDGCWAGQAVNDAALDKMFRSAHTTRKWLEKPVSAALLMAIYDLTRWGPTSANISPLRIVFVVSAQAKLMLKPYLNATNVRQTMEAPATAILGYDLDFARHLPRLYRDNPNAQSWFSDDEQIKLNAFRNATLQAGYFIIAARALGLDCGPMSGFDNKGVDSQFFADTKIYSNLLCNLGYGAQDGTRARNERLSFDEACKII